MNNHYTIIWQKWVDPFGSESEVFDDDKSDSDNFDDDKQDTGSYKDWSEETEEIKEDKQRIIKSTKVIATPMGIIPIDENTASGKIFNFWVGHTNFDITPQICEIIENTYGVECLDIFTRYRFRIAIGKAFNPGETMNLIQNNIYNFLEYDNAEK